MERLTGERAVEYSSLTVADAPDTMRYLPLAKSANGSKHMGGRSVGNWSFWLSCVASQRDYCDATSIEGSIGLGQSKKDVIYRFDCLRQAAFLFWSVTRWLNRPYSSPSRNAGTAFSRISCASLIGGKTSPIPLGGFLIAKS